MYLVIYCLGEKTVLIRFFVKRFSIFMQIFIFLLSVLFLTISFSIYYIFILISIFIPGSYFYCTGQLLFIVPVNNTTNLKREMYNLFNKRLGLFIFRSHNSFEIFMLS